MRPWFRFFWYGFHKALERPAQLAFFAVVLAIAGLLSDGTLMHIWNLTHEKENIQTKIIEIQRTNSQLHARIKEAKSSDRFIGRQARENLELVKEDELVFIFENENLLETHTAER